LVGTVCVSVAVLAGHRRKALGLAFALAAGSLVIAPYLHSLVAQKDPSQSIRISRDWGEWAPHFLHVVVVLVPLWFFIALRRRTLVEQLSRRSWVHWAVAGSALALLLAYIFLHVPGHAGYKYRAMAVLFLAVMAAPGLKSIYTYNRFVFVGIVSLLFFSLMFDSVHKLTRGGPVSELTLADGFVLRHADASEDALYQWISRHTTANAIIVDNKPYVPVFAHRPLFVARGGRGLEGWSTSTTFWLGEVHGHRRRAIEARNEIVDNLYSPTATPRDDTAWRLAELTGDRPVFIVARNEEQQAALEQKPFIRKAASTEDWAIFEFIK